MTIVDGNDGTVIIDPDEETLARFRDSKARYQSFRRPARITPRSAERHQDGVAITLYGNIEFPGEAEACHHRGAEGIGLYRTEFLYLNSHREPTEEDHYQAYCRCWRPSGRPFTIRTLDLGRGQNARRLAGRVPEGINPA